MSIRTGLNLVAACLGLDAAFRLIWSLGPGTSITGIIGEIHAANRVLAPDLLTGVEGMDKKYGPHLRKAGRAAWKNR